MSFFEELKRRNVVRVGIAYAIMAWLLLQIGDFALDLVGAPNWVIQTLFVLVVLGLPVALFFAWAFELTPEGIKRETEVDRERSVATRTGRKLDIAIMGSLLLIAGYFIWEARFKPDAAGPAESGADEVLAGANGDPTPAPAAPAATSDSLPKDTIAVLPFANRSRREDDLFFADGIHDDLLTQLARIDALKVISRTSVMTYRETDKRIPEIAAELGAGIILEGGVQRAGDRVRINAQLIDVATDQHLWADSFDREMTIDNLFDIQSEISRQIVAAVKGTVSEEDSRSLDNRPTDSLAAWEAAVRAQAILRETDYETAKYERAAPFVAMALEADPEFAEAWVLLAEIQLQGIWMGDKDTPAQRGLARSSVDRAVALAPGTPAVLAAEAEYEYRVNLDYEASLSLIEQAIDRAPSTVGYHHHRALCLRRLGRYEAAFEAFDTAIALDPLDSYAAATKAETLAFVRDWDRLETLLDRWLPMDPDSFDLLFWKYQLFVNRDGNLEGARALLDDAELAPGTRLALAFEELARLERDWNGLMAVATDPDNQSFMPVMDLTRDFRVGRAYAFQGDRETASAFFERYVTATQQSGRHGRIGRAVQAANMAQAHALMGDGERALRFAREADAIMADFKDTLFEAWVHSITTHTIALAGRREEALARLAADLDRPGGWTRWTLYLDPAWDFFRDDPRFNDLVRPNGVAPDPLRAQRLANES